MGVVKFWSKAYRAGILIAVASGVLVTLVGAEPPDLDDKAVRERIIAEAIPVSELKNVGTSEEPLLTLPGETVGYSGWVKAESGGVCVLLSQFKAGKRDGLEAWWHENGQKQSESTYKDGKLEGLNTMWYESGQKAEEGTYKDGKMDGLATWWHDNGEKEHEGTYKDGKQEGLVTQWHDNGQTKLEVTFKDGKKHGLFTEWTENGVKINEVTYKDDVIVD
jgi:hypothetical protein